MKHQLARLFEAATFAVLLAVTTSTFASDGVIELNQAKIMAAGGYPYTIANRGSYILTGNLTVASGNGNGIVIGANGVTLDLNGFSIIGGGAFCGVISARAITSANPGQQVTVRNGFITGFCLGITLSTTTQVTIERMNIATTGNGAIYTGVNAVLRGNHFNGTNSGVNCPSIVLDTSFLGSSGNNGIPTLTCAKSNLIGTF